MAHMSERNMADDPDFVPVEKAKAVLYEEGFDNVVIDEGVLKAFSFSRVLYLNISADGLVDGSRIIETAQ